MLKYASEGDITIMKNVPQAFWTTFHAFIAVWRSFPASSGAYSIHRNPKNHQNDKKIEISRWGSTGRQDGAPPVAIGSATKFRIFHHLSVWRLGAMQKI